MTTLAVAPAGLGCQRQPSTVWLWVILALLLAACGPAATPEAAPPAANDDFRPTDPAAVSLAAGRPQLVEFFAFW